MSTLLFIIATVIALLTTYCSSQGSNNDPAYAPEINPHPKYFMAVKGQIDPSLINKINLQIIANYQTHSEQCQQNINALEGVYRPLVNEVTYNAKPNSEGYYTIGIPLDYYLPGSCQWAIFGLSDKVNTPGGYIPQTFIVFTNANKVFKKSTQPQLTLVKCKTANECYWEKIGGYDHPLPVNQNYYYQYDILAD